MLLFSFVISTISLAAINSGLKTDVAQLRQEIYDIHNPTTTTIAPETEPTSDVSSVATETTVAIETTVATSETTAPPVESILHYLSISPEDKLKYL